MKIIMNLELIKEKISKLNEKQYNEMFNALGFETNGKLNPNDITDLQIEILYIFLKIKNENRKNFINFLSSLVLV